MRRAVGALGLGRRQRPVSTPWGDPMQSSCPNSRPAASSAAKSPPWAVGERFRPFATAVGPRPRLPGAGRCRRATSLRLLPKSRPARRGPQLIDEIGAGAKRRALSTVFRRRGRPARRSHPKVRAVRRRIRFSQGNAGRAPPDSARVSEIDGSHQDRSLSVESARRGPGPAAIGWKGAAWASGEEKRVEVAAVGWRDRGMAGSRRRRLAARRSGGKRPAWARGGRRNGEACGVGERHAARGHRRVAGVPAARLEQKRLGVTFSRPSEQGASFLAPPRSGTWSCARATITMIGPS